jgi:hypothetical protein
MKQAVLITAYKDFSLLTDILNYFSGDTFEFYIHIDKKSKSDIENIKNIPTNNLKLLSRKFKINWGGINHLKCILLLAEEALKNKEIIFFHLISGQDFPVKELSYFDVISNKKKDYLEYFEMPAKCWKNGGMDRVELYNFYDILDAKKHQKIISILNYLQKKLNFKRTISNKIPKLFAGSTYWSLTRDTLQYVIDYTNNNKTLINRLKYTFCAEEIYFQSVIMNSDFLKNVINDNLRYIDWDSGRGGYPAVIDTSDFSSIESSNKLFARKFDLIKSNELKLKLIAAHSY